jgi:hypothetical protein
MCDALLPRLRRISTAWYASLWLHLPLVKCVALMQEVYCVNKIEKRINSIPKPIAKRTLKKGSGINTTPNNTIPPAHFPPECAACSVLVCDFTVLRTSRIPRETANLPYLRVPEEKSLPAGCPVEARHPQIKFFPDWKEFYTIGGPGRTCTPPGAVGESPLMGACDQLSI